MNKFEQAIQEELKWIEENLLSIINQLASETTLQYKIELQIKYNCLMDEQARLLIRISD